MQIIRLRGCKYGKYDKFNRLIKLKLPSLSGIDALLLK
jgi:hypothetical protein